MRAYLSAVLKAGAAQATPLRRKHSSLRHGEGTCRWKIKLLQNLRTLLEVPVTTEAAGRLPPRGNIVKHVDAMYLRLIDGQLTNEDKTSLRAFFLMSRFRQELENLLAEQGLRSLEDAEWNRFLTCFLNIIEDCSLTCKAPGLANVDAVVLIRKNWVKNVFPRRKRRPSYGLCTIKSEPIFMIGRKLREVWKRAS